MCLTLTWTFNGWNWFLLKCYRAVHNLQAISNQNSQPNNPMCNHNTQTFQHTFPKGGTNQLEFLSTAWPHFLPFDLSNTARACDVTLLRHQVLYAEQLHWSDAGLMVSMLLPRVAFVYNIVGLLGLTPKLLTFKDIQRATFGWPNCGW